MKTPDHLNMSFPAIFELVKAPEWILLGGGDNKILNSLIAYALLSYILSHLIKLLISYH